MELEYFGLRIADCGLRIEKLLDLTSDLYPLSSVI